MNKIAIEDCHVIVCGPAIGKTYLAKCDDRFIDLDGERAVYKYGLENKTLSEQEFGKLNRGDVVNKDYKLWTKNRLIELLNSDKIILVSYHKDIINYLIENNIDFCEVYAAKELREEYATRMKNRNNSDEFINKMTNEEIWNKFYEENSTNPLPKYKIELERGMYLSDIKEWFIYKKRSLK